MNRQCSEPECDRTRVARGYCARHYQRLRVQGAFKGDTSAKFNSNAPRPFATAPLFALVPATSDVERADKLGVSRRQYQRFKKYGALTVDQADQAGPERRVAPVRNLG